MPRQLIVIVEYQQLEHHKGRPELGVEKRIERYVRKDEDILKIEKQSN